MILHEAEAQVRDPAKIVIDCSKVRALCAAVRFPGAGGRSSKPGPPPSALAAWRGATRPMSASAAAYTKLRLYCSIRSQQRFLKKPIAMRLALEAHIAENGASSGFARTSRQMRQFAWPWDRHASDKVAQRPMAQSGPCFGRYFHFMMT